MRLRALIACTAACAVFVPAALAAPESPATDPFYKAPADLAEAAPGTVLRSRQVDVSLGPAPLTGSGYSAFQLLYRTNDATDQPVATATTVIVPDGDPPAGGRQLVSLQDAEDSLDPICAPSYQLQTGEQDNHNMQAELGLVTNQLALGRAIVIPDHDGPESQYVVTGMEGHATLDSIRAVERFPAAGLKGAATQVGLIGYSGGAHASAAANELQPAYAPELNIVGVAAGGVPVGNEENARYLDGSVGASLLVGLAVSLDRAFPELDVNSLLNDKGKALAEELKKGCATSVFAAPFTHMDDYTTAPNAYALPRVKAIIERNSLGHATPTAPTFYYNAINDELIAIKPLDEMVAKYCAAGARIDYFRDPVAQEHIEALHDFVPLALSYLSDRFDGKEAPTTCAPVPATNTPPPAAPAKTSSCATARHITVHVSPRGRITRAAVRVNGRTVRALRRGARALRITLRGRTSGVYRVVATVRLADGSRAQVARTYRFC